MRGIHVHKKGVVVKNLTNVWVSHAGQQQFCVDCAVFILQGRIWTKRLRGFSILPFEQCANNTGNVTSVHTTQLYAHCSITPHTDPPPLLTPPPSPPPTHSPSLPLPPKWRPSPSQTPVPSESNASSKSAPKPSPTQQIAEIYTKP